MGTRFFEAPIGYPITYNLQPRVLPTLKPFDLKVGDKIAVRERAGVNEIGEDPENSSCVTHYYTVTAIYPFVFMVKNRLGIPTSFQKKEYQLGWIRRVTE